MIALYLGRGWRLSLLDERRLDTTSERHRLDLVKLPCDWQGPPLDAFRRDPALRGLVIEMDRGYVRRSSLRLAVRVLALGHRVWVHWPDERAVEVIERDRLGSLWRHWALSAAYFGWQSLRDRTRGASLGVRRTVSGVGGNVRRFVRLTRRDGVRAAMTAAAAHLGGAASREERAALRRAFLDACIAGAAPAPLACAGEPSPGRRIPGTGAYLRTDFWVRIESGGSYGHTCYVAKELAGVTEAFVCFTAQHYRLLDDYGLRQVVMEPRGEQASEDEIVTATDHYYRILKPAFEAIRPAYLYERLCLGNYVGARLSRELGIPYIVEYNGSEISMRRSFEGSGYIYEDEYLKAEMYAFRQATMISVISRAVKEDLVGRGIDAGKILVNPNGADPAAYAPPTPEEKRAVKASAGLAPDKPVIGFTGTFGGWHGVDVLAASLPAITSRVPDAQFLLIGDGHYKYLVDAAVGKFDLHDRVRMMGRVPQAEGARLLKACDLFVSPHNKHMLDSRFFGSPTKVFEYMAVGGGIVASDLEQIGECLSPGITVAALRDLACVVTDQRAVLCTPGDVDEFTEAVVLLLLRPDVSAALGRNARTAVLEHFSWNRHIAHLWPFLRRQTPASPAPDAPGAHAAATAPIAPVEPARRSATAAPPLITGDADKDEVQQQWDNDPAGSHYVETALPHTLDWFLEAEAYRYGSYAPWMAETMEFAAHAGEDVLEIGGGMGTDLAQFARHGARVTDVDLAAGHLELAEENFRLRGLPGRFVHHDAETLPFDDESLDVVYSNGVLHHTPNTRDLVREIRRVLRPGGLAIVMVYAENSLVYWRNLVWTIGLKQRQLLRWSMGDIMSRSVERRDNAAARPLVKVYTRRRLAAMFAGFEAIEVVQRQLIAGEVPRLLARVPRTWLARRLGWNLIIKARKPRR